MSHPTVGYQDLAAPRRRPADRVMIDRLRDSTIALIGSRIGSAPSVDSTYIRHDVRNGIIWRICAKIV